LESESDKKGNGKEFLWLKEPNYLWLSRRSNPKVTEKGSGEKKREVDGVG